MNAQNPFQIPNCYQNEFQNRRRERFKKAVIIGVGATAALLVGLLIEGCVSEHSKAAAVIPAQPAAKPVVAAVAQPKPISIPQPMPVVRPAATVPLAKAVPASQAAGTVYVVKSGDTLTKIARKHGTTLKALMSVNDLGNDHVVVGEKLKIPTA